MLNNPFGGGGSKLHPRGSLRQQGKVPGTQHPSADGFKGHGGYRLGYFFPPRNQGPDVTHVEDTSASAAVSERAAGLQLNAEGF